MPNITVQFNDGSSHVYEGVPESVTREQAAARAQKDFGKTIVAMDRDTETSGSNTKAKPSFLARHGRDIAVGAGGVIGGMVGLPAAGLAAIPTLGLGGIATEAAGMGLGAGMGGQAYDLAQRLMGHKETLTPGQRVGQALGDVTSNAAMAPAGRMIGAAVPVVAKAAAPYARNIIEAIPGSSAKATRLAKGLIESAKGTATQRAAAAGTSAKTNQAIAEQARAKAAEFGAVENPSINSVGQVRDPAEIGGPLQQTATNEERNLIAQRANADKILRNTRDQIVSENEAKGLNITNTPTYKTALNTLAGWKTAPGKAPELGVQKVYEGILERISPQRIELNPQEAKTAVSQGVKVIQDGGKIYREFKPTFQNVDSARRFLGDVFSGKVEGYGAISSLEKQKLYGVLKNIEEEYVGAAQPRLQANWRQKTGELVDFDTKIGKKLTGTQPGTDIPSQTPEAIANAAFGGTLKGAADYDQLVAALRGNERVARKAASDYVATQLEGKTYDQAAKTVDRLRPMLKNERLADLLSRTDSYLSKLQNGETSAKNAIAEISTANKASISAERAAANQAKHLNAVTDLIASQKAPKEGAAAAMKYFENLSKIPVEKGGISPDQYAKIRNEYFAIDFSKPEAAKAAIKKWSSRAAKGTAYLGAAALGLNAVKKIIGNPTSALSEFEQE